MKKLINTSLAILAGLYLVATQVGCTSRAKNQLVAKKIERKFHLRGVYGHKPWKGGTGRKAMMMALSAKG
jgi:hypothetical protein